MKKTTKARQINSASLQALFDELSPLEMEQTKVKMQLAARIEDYVNAKGWSKSEFATRVGKNPSEITKWFSGTQNFTIDVLSEISLSLGVPLIALFERSRFDIVYRQEIALTLTSPQHTIPVITPLSKGLPAYAWHGMRSGNKINTFATNYPT